MKITKNKLINLVKGKLSSLGYIEMKDDESDGLFGKKTINDLYLTLGLTMSNLYDNLFTGDFYLSKTTCWNCLWGDIPRESSTRPGMLLSEIELSKYSSNTYDIWWNAANINSIDDFVRVVGLAELRFVNQPELFRKINDSKDVNLLVELTGQVKNIVHSPSLVFECKYLPKKEINNIPMKWFEAAEMVLSTNNRTISRYLVKRLAEDAYRQTMLDNLVYL